MNVLMLTHTPAATGICGMAAAICTGSTNPNKALDHALESGHESVLEHASFTFQIEGVSRALLAQLTRHRIASFSVQSQRYCNAGDSGSVMPDSIKSLSQQAKNVYYEAIGNAYAAYDRLVELGAPKEDARFVLPNAAETRLIMTMNARELRHFFGLRCCNRAQWEIRQLADEMLRLCKSAAPALFKDAGCACMAGKPCPEGKKSCGHPRTGGGGK